MKIPAITSALLCLIACSVGVSFDIPLRQETKTIEGRWRLESVEENGKPVDLGEHRPRWVIKGNTVQYGGDPLAELKLDPSSSPKCIDLNWTKPKRSYEGIYSLDGETLKLCVNRDTEGAKDRPQDFATEGKSNLRLLTFKRDTEENNDPSLGVGGFVGLMISQSEDKKHVIVVAALADSPAEKAGLIKDDVILTLNSNAITELQEMVAVIRKQKPGQEIAFKINRGGQEKELKLAVGKLPFLYLE